MPEVQLAAAGWKNAVGIMSDGPLNRVVSTLLEVRKSPRRSGRWSCYTGRYLIEIERKWAVPFSGLYR
jgi:hypothetical protein